MALFPKRLPRPVRADLEAAYAGGNRTPGRVLGAAEATSGWCVLLTDALAVQTRGSWELIRWNDVETGGWNSQNNELFWELASGRRGSARLDEPGLLPEIFRERVEASIVVHKRIEIEGTREGAVVSARRDLGDRDADIVWRTRYGRGTPRTGEVEAILEAAVTSLRADFDF